MSANDQLKKALAEAEYYKSRFNYLLGWSPVAVYECEGDSDFTMRYISSHVEVISGFPATDFINNSVRSYASIIHPDDRAYVEWAVADAVTRHVSFDLRYRINHRDGQIRWVWEQGSADPSRGCLVGAIFDITKQKENEDKLRFMQDRLEAAQRIAKVGSWEFDLATQDLTWSSEHYRIFEIPEPQPSEQLFTLYRSRIHPDDLPVMDRYIDRAIRLGEGFTYNHRVILDNGQRIKHVQGIGRVVSDANGQFVKVTGTCQDLTARVEMEEENRFILEALGIGVWKFNPVSSELHWDQSMYKIFDVNPAAFSGHYQAWESTLTPETRKEAVRELELALSGQKEFDTRFQITTSKGVRTIAGRGRVVRSLTGEPLMMYGVNFDITREVEMESRLEIEKAKATHSAKLASLGEMSAGMAHEVNNPLAIISSSIPVIRKNIRSPDKIERRLQSMERAATRISKIVTGLRKFARLPNEDAMAWTRLDTLIDESMFLFESRLKNHMITINIQVACQVELFCDAIEIEQVIVNMVNNAIDAVKNNEERWVQIQVDQSPEGLVLRVIDSGGGISPEVEQKLFDPFFTTKKVGEGTGLGLSIVRGILEHHKATIAVNRNFKNTCFEILFTRFRELQNAA